MKGAKGTAGKHLIACENGTDYKHSNKIFYLYVECTVTVAVISSAQHCDIIIYFFVISLIAFLTFTTNFFSQGGEVITSSAERKENVSILE